ncbi:MAG: hypothetical protein M3361_00190 [Candidatus Tectomicrobia bacterium]|nr:hypothetical protein [Candidatus Tectomicrobia bacterium]
MPALGSFDRDGGTSGSLDYTHCTSLSGFTETSTDQEAKAGEGAVILMDGPRALRA